MKFITISPDLIVENQIPLAKPTQLDEIEAIETSVDANIGKEVHIPKDVMTSFKIKDSLNPEIWPNNHLDPAIQVKLMKIANGFLKDLNLGKGYKIKDVIFTGSLANFNWSKFSDIDLHVVLDYDQFDGDPEMVADYFWSQKTLWNNEHDISIKGYPVEVYAQDAKEKFDATAIYSVLRNKWVRKPVRENLSLDDNAIKAKANKYINQLKFIRDEYKDHHYQTVIDTATKLKDKIQQMRKAGLENGGEYSLENLVFKVLRRTPFMDVLSSYKIKAYDNLMTVSEMETLDEGKVLNNTQFKEETSEDTININAFYESHRIGNVELEEKMSDYREFKDVISEDDFEQLFPEDTYALLSYLKIYNDKMKGEGVAKKLVQLAMDKAKALGYNTITLNASPGLGQGSLNLSDLVGFYESFGFQVFKHQGNNALMIFHFNNNRLNEDAKSLQGGVIFIKGAKLENGEQRLYATTVKDLVMADRKKTDNSEGQIAKMAVFGNNRVFRVGLDGDRLKAFTVAWGNTAQMLQKMGLKNTSVVLNDNKTPMHWLSTQTNNVAEAVKDLSGKIQSIPNIKWVG